MKIKSLIFILLLCAVVARLSSQTYSVSDSLALLTIDNTCDVLDSLNWDTEPDPGNWAGVTWNSENPKRVTELSVSNKSLTGAMDVSDLAGLTYLSCYENELTGLNISSLTNLTYLVCSFNQLSSLDASTLTALTYLSCYDNQLTTLDVSALTNLIVLYCSGNQLTELDVSALTNLTQLSCSENQLTGLDVSALTSLVTLDCSNNQITELDVSTLTNLSQLSCSENQLTNIDMSALINLTDLICSHNQLTGLDASTLTELTYLSCQYNQLTTLNVSELTNLNYLYCSFNQLTILELSALTNLIELACSYNQFTGLNVSDLINLNYLNCSSNQLTSLDVSALTNITELYCHLNQLTSLVVSGLINLKNFYCYNNKLTGLDVSTLTNLTRLFCDNNQLTELDVSALTNLAYLHCSYNRLPFSSLATGLHVNDYSYSPQDSIFVPYAIAVNVTLDYSAEALIDDTATQFIFYKDDVEVDTNTTGLFSTTGTGVYYCQMTNAKFPGLTLTTASVTVTGETPSLELSVSSLNVGADPNSTATFDIISNTIWDVTSSQSWLTVNPDSGLNNQTITVIAEENIDETTRDATVTVSGTGVTPKTVVVTQEGTNVSSFYAVNYNNDILYPNPVKDKLHIRLSQNNLPSLIGIYTMSGKQLMSIETKSPLIEIDMETFQPGIYILKIITPGSSFEEEVVKL